MDSIRGQKSKLLMTDDQNLHASIHNRFDIEVVDSKTGKIKQKAQAENIICDNLWNYMFSGKMIWNKNIQYGSGSGTPSASDVSLFSFLGVGTPSDAVYNGNDFTKIASVTRHITLLETEQVGKTFTEVGISATTSSSGSLCTHALIKDMNGNPISIIKTNTDILSIYATVFLHGYLDSGNIYKCFNIGQYPSSFLKFGLGMSSGPGLGRIDLFPNSSSSATATFDIQKKTVTYVYNRVAASSYNNTNGFKKLKDPWGGEGASGIEMIVPFTGCLGTDISLEAIGTGDGQTKDFKTKFDFIKTADVLIDGTIVSTATVDKGTPFTVQDALNSMVPIFTYDGEAVPSYMKRDATNIYQNQYASSFGFSSISASRGNVEISVSNDGKTWTVVGSSTTVNIPTEYQRSEYWKFVNKSNYEYGNDVTFTLDGDYSKNIHFTEAPDSGAVITANYFTETIAKDENHVYDRTMSITYGPHTT